MKDLLRTEDLSRADVELLLGTAKEFAENPLKASSLLMFRMIDSPVERVRMIRPFTD